MNKTTIKYLETYAGRELVNKHTLNTVGVWRVRGEDPNCDWGGSHHQPDMGIYEGCLESVLDQVTAMSGFWQWGAGGSLELVKINPAKTVAQVARDQETDQEILAQLDAVKQKARTRGLIK